MPKDSAPKDLHHVLDCISAVAERQEEVSIECVVDAIGRRSFGPILLLPGLVLVSPLSGIPSVPTIMAIMTALVTLQLLIGRKRFWLPAWLLQRAVKAPRLIVILQFMRKPALYVDKLLKPRLLWMTEGSAYYGCALICLILSLTLPPTEMVPFAATGAGIAISSMALSLITRDGLLALLSFSVTLGILAAFGNILFLR